MADDGGARNGYREVASVLQGRVEGGEFAPGSYLPTERKLQEDYGVSRTTVRRALASLIDAGWAEALPGRGVVAARGFRRATSGKVAVIDNDSYVANVLHARMREGLQALGLEPVNLGRGAGYSMEDALRKTAEDEFMAALVWSYEGFPNAELVASVNRQLPIVALDHRLEGAECDLVTFDYERAAYDATSHLIAQGSRRIGVVGMLDMLEITHARFRGYLRAMFAHGIQPEPRDFLFVATSGHNRADPSVLESRLRSGDRPDGMLVMQDGYVAATVAAALRSGLALPGDLRIATLGDDYDVRVDGLRTTAVAFDWDGFVREALGLLQNRMANLHGPPLTRRAGYRLVVRGLSGAPPSGWTEPEEEERLVPRPERRFTTRWNAQDDA